MRPVAVQFWRKSQFSVQQVKKVQDFFTSGAAEVMTVALQFFEVYTQVKPW